MNAFDRLRLEVRALVGRVAALEAAGARPAPRKRERTPRPTDAVITARQTLWARYIELEMRFGHGRVRLTKLSFAARYSVNPTELGRWLSPTDARGIAEGSKPDRSHRRALADAISELEARGKNQTDNIRLNSRGNAHASQDSGARWQ